MCDPQQPRDANQEDGILAPCSQQALGYRMQVTDEKEQQQSVRLSAAKLRTLGG